MQVHRNIPSMLSPQELMRFALVEAALGTWRVRPNPRVGAALLTADGTLVADHHKQVGQNHAEREVLARCQELNVSPRGATMAVTLEPCAHQGRTPPCVDAILEAGIQRVYVGSRDTASWVNGRGLEKLRQAGVEVLEDVLRPECDELNWGWLKSHELKRAFVRLKMATSLDGRWRAANGESQWITGPKARALGRALRAQSDLIITGRGTVKADDPQFTVRDENDQLSDYQPKVLVLSRKTDFTLEGFKLAVHPAGATVERADSLEDLLIRLHSENIFEVHVEAGPGLSQHFLDAGLVDELHLFVAPKLLGGTGNGFDQGFLQGKLPGLQFRFHSQNLTEDGDMYLILRA